MSWDVGSVLQLQKRSGTVSQIFLDLPSDAEAQLASAAPSQNPSDSEVGVEADNSRVRHAAEAQLASAAPSRIPCVYISILPRVTYPKLNLYTLANNAR